MSKAEKKQKLRILKRAYSCRCEKSYNVAFGVNAFQFQIIRQTSSTVATLVPHIYICWIWNHCNLLKFYIIVYCYIVIIFISVVDKLKILQLELCICSRQVCHAVVIAARNEFIYTYISHYMSPITSFTITFHTINNIHIYKLIISLFR